MNPHLEMIPFVILVPLFMIDSLARTTSVALLLKAYYLVTVRVCFAVGLVSLYGIWIYFYEESYWCQQVLMLVAYPVANIFFIVRETFCRHTLTTVILVIVYSKNVIGEIELCLGVLASTFLMAFSFWRCCCITEDRSLNDTSDDNISDVETEG